MMTVNNSVFGELRLDAARAFAQTMIFIDDEAGQGHEPQPVGPLRPPSRKTHSGSTTADASAEQGERATPSSRALNSKSLIDKAMDLGLICSVLCPKEGENFRSRVAKAAQVADIVCLDWDIHGDSGDISSKIIGDIIQEDAGQNGRLRLIAIYTVEADSSGILDKVFDAIPEELRKNHEFQKESLTIESNSGVRIVCLFKYGIHLREPKGANQVDEDRLPERLQTEFAKLSKGLLSNVALTTIASIRRSTHHVLSKFTDKMDGPFFHHRALIESPDDAEEYAVDIVLSELKAAVDKQQVAATYAGPQAIEARIREIAGSASELQLHYEKKGSHCTFGLEADVCIEMIKDGLRPVLDKQYQKLSNRPSKPSKRDFKDNLSTLFGDGQETARSQMHQFAALTGVRAHPGSHPYRSGQLLPKLGLGTIIQSSEDKTYLLCLQASCDSVRIKGERSFLFIPLDLISLDTKDTNPEHVVPTPSGANKLNYIGLSSKPYYEARSVVFSACQKTKTVNAKSVPGRSGLYFEDKMGEAYLWVADLKHQFALRTVQHLGQRMGRLGFDEFEPYRRKQERF